MISYAKVGLIWLMQILLFTKSNFVCLSSQNFKQIAQLNNRRMIRKYFALEINESLGFA